MSEFSAVESIFHAALAKATPEERAEFLTEACGDNAELRRQIEELLKAQDNAGSFLVQPAAETIPYVPVEGPGTRIGPYKLLQQIGEGGMGIVYMAEQEQPVRRRVALKVIKPGMDSAQVIARFQAERQALAMMDHQNIARVFDAGTTDAGRPYFVMELVHGVPITKYCDDAKLTPRQRLDLFVPVCRAIQHAHQKGILHRDIKPSNVLVCLYDGVPVPKVIDFGVAKAMEQSLTERTMFTQFGQVIGTLEYMSPEQAEMSQLGVDTRSDVYSLGVLLYELLTGSTPLERKRLREAGMAEILRMIREEEPPPPSTRLIDSKESLVTIAQQRHTEPAQLTRQVRGELDWIVMKSIEKDRTRRYESAGSLAGDLERYLKDEPVEACPPSATYRLRKYARKHRLLLATTAAFVLLLVAGTGISVWFAITANDAVSAARTAEEDAREAENAALEAKKAALIDRDKARQARDELDRASDKLRRGLYASDMNLVRTASEADNARRVADILERHKPGPGEIDLRGFEWYYWRRQYRSELSSVQLEMFPRDLTLFGDVGPKLSPSGRLCVLARSRASRTELKIWETSSGRLVCDAAIALPDKNEAKSLQFNPEETLLLLSSDRPPSTADIMIGVDPDSTIANRVIEVATGKVLHSPEKEVRFHSDGRRLFQLSKTSTATSIVWSDAFDGSKLKALTIPFSGFNWTYDDKLGTKLAIEVFPGIREVKIVDAENGLAIFSVELPPAASLSNSLSWSPDGQKIACLVQNSSLLDSEGDLSVFDAASGKRLWKRQPDAPLNTKRHKGDHLQSRAIFLDNRRILLTSTSKSGFEARIVDTENGNEAPAKHDDDRLGSSTLAKSFFGSDLAVTRDGRLFCNKVPFSVWSTQTGELVFTAKLPTHVEHCQFDPAGAQLQSVDHEGVFRVWDATSWPRRAKGRPSGETEASEKDPDILNPDGRLIARIVEVAAPKNAILQSTRLAKTQTRLDLLDATTGQPLRTFGPFSGRLEPPTFLAGGKRVVAPLMTIGTTEVLVFEIESGQHYVIWRQSEKPGQLLRVAQLMDCADGSRGSLLLFSPMLRGVDINFVGQLEFFDFNAKKHLSSSSRKMGSQISGLKPLFGPPSAEFNEIFRASALSADGAQEATTTLDQDSKTKSMIRRIVIRDTNTGKIAREFAAPELRMPRIEFSPDGGRLLLSGTGPNGSLDFVVFDSVTGKSILELKNIGARSLTFSPDGRRLFGSISEQIDGPQGRHTYGFWNADDGRELGTIVTEWTPSPLQFTPDSHRLIALRENWQQRFPGDAVLVIDATPFPEDLPKSSPGKK